MERPTSFSLSSYPVLKAFQVRLNVCAGEPGPAFVAVGTGNRISSRVTAIFTNSLR